MAKRACSWFCPVSQSLFPFLTPHCSFSLSFWAISKCHSAVILHSQAQKSGGLNFKAKVKERHPYQSVCLLPPTPPSPLPTLLPLSVTIRSEIRGMVKSSQFAHTGILSRVVWRSVPLRNCAKSCVDTASSCGIMQYLRIQLYIDLLFFFILSQLLSTNRHRQWGIAYLVPAKWLSSQGFPAYENRLPGRRQGLFFHVWGLGKLHPERDERDTDFLPVPPQFAGLLARARPATDQEKIS